MRYYSEHKVPENELFEIIERAANNAPSVCNRQTCRVYLVADEDSVSFLRFKTEIAEWRVLSSF